MTRLLNTPIIGPSTAIVDSSWIDIEAGLVSSGIRKMPPDFCAKAGAAPRVAANNARATIPTHRRMSCSPAFGEPLSIEPDVFEAPAVGEAVDHCRQPFHL